MLEPNHYLDHHRLLVVDDEEAVLKVTKVILNRAQYEVVTCENANDALHLLQRQSFDCVISDVAMPGKDGYDLVREIRQELHNNVPILMLTKKRNRQDVKKAVAAGITDYILKPIDENLLLDKVELCIKKGPGNKHTLNSPISETQAPASLFFDCRMQFISETYFVARIPFLIPCDTEVQIRTPLFDEIGISPPIIKLVSCKAIPMSLESRTYPYEAHFSLVGVLESDLRKIRIWINRESLQRRK